MKVSTRLGIAAVMVVTVALPSSLSAHEADLIKAGRKAGPIRLQRTTLSQARDWFGEPLRRRNFQYQCIQAIRVTWPEPQIIFTRDEERRAVTAKIRDRTVSSNEHGTLRIHTKKGLRVGDSERRLRELYPNKEGETHRGHTHYILVSGPNDGRLLARVERDEVVELETGPYEAC